MSDNNANSEQIDLNISGDITIKQPDSSEVWKSKMPANGKVVVNFKDVGEIDSTCVALMISLMRNSQVNEVELSFANLPEKLTKLIGLYKIGDLINVHLTTPVEAK